MENKLNFQIDNGQHEVWLDTGITEFDGLIIGLGGTLTEAIDSARTELLSAIAELETKRGKP